MSDGPRDGQRRSVGLQADVYSEGAAITPVGVDADAPHLKCRRPRLKPQPIGRQSNTQLRRVLGAAKRPPHLTFAATASISTLNSGRENPLTTNSVDAGGGLLTNSSRTFM
jgi:hypothetical protein